MLPPRQEVDLKCVGIILGFLFGAFWKRFGHHFRTFGFLGGSLGSPCATLDILGHLWGTSELPGALLAISWVSFVYIKGASGSLCLCVGGIFGCSFASFCFVCVSMFILCVCVCFFIRGFIFLLC